MPELPEVETVKRTLEKEIAGLYINGADIHLEKVIRAPSPAEFTAQLSGRKIKRLSRRGKYLLIHLTGGMTLVIHLRMTGQLVVAPPGTRLEKHTHAVFYISDSRELHYTDTRQFGRMALVETASLEDFPGIRSLGVEPLSDEFTRDMFKKMLKRRRTRIKTLLLDQTFIAGIGNIYTDEALFRAGINPAKLAVNLTGREAARLHQAVREVLTEGISNRGTSIRDYVDGRGEAGTHQHFLKVYDRDGHPCPNCGKIIEKKKLAGRSTHYCPTCQK